ncbi:MAG TPA: branched-chain amino acid ABC transporter permease, partial [Xanthobacteraceae bacterium]|nr:branched-chain amino acid ABC transporter permease [Xanthobacteraceae bacterium]
LALVVSSCARPIDGEQLRICRLILPALHPQSSEIREIRATPVETGRKGIKIEYRVREPGKRAELHYASCGFAGGALESGRLDLVAVDTEQGSLGEARLLYLKRFWLGAFGVAAGEAPETALPVKVPQIAPATAYAIQQLINAVALAAVYGLLATAYSLIYGLIGRINFAFGEIAVLGAYSAVTGVAATIGIGFGDPIGALAAALAVAALMASLWSWAIGAVVIAPLHQRHRLGQPVLVATIAVAIAIQEALRISQGARDRWLPPLFNDPIPLARGGNFVVTVTAIEIVVVVIALVAAGIVLWFLMRSRFGRQWRAYADDPAAAAMLGVAPQRIQAGTFVLAGALAGIAGWIVAVYYGNVGFAMGMMLGLKALVAAVVGGIGSVPGAFLGGVLVAFIEGLWSAYFDVGARDIVVYSVLIVVFVLRPGGILGLSAPSPREV